MTTLSCCIVCKTPSPSLDRAITSVRPFVDEVVLVWTRKPDASVVPDGVDVTAFFDGCNAQVDCPENSSCQCKIGDIVDFSSARNFSFSLATGDLCTYIDSDDVLSGKGDLRSLYQEGVRVVSPYEYRFNGLGQCVEKQYVDRVVPKGTRWSEPVHNMLTFEPGLPFRKDDSFVWRHQRDQDGVKASRDRSLRILRHWERASRYVNDARFTYYLGRVHADAGLLGRATRELERAFELEVDVEMRAVIALDLANCWSAGPAGAVKYALSWAHKALELQPEWPASWLALAKLYCDLGKENVALNFARGGLSCDPPATFLPYDPSLRERTRQEFRL